ncbi:MAG: ABC transporter ATP-binding protein [Phycisphaerales bacterium]|nr:MAG: ABC transporter ATP-binding protein [Phycisphaerales bacterium]
MNGSSPIIKCSGLCKTYDTGRNRVEAVRGLDLEVHSGECFGLLGPNGAGKTTTVEILEGLLAPTSGSVEVLGMRWGAGGDRALRQQIGITLQETRLNDKLTVVEVVTLFRSFYRRGLDPAGVIEAVSLQEKRKARVEKLSGGQRQRLAVACALVGDPQLLFLDEPTTGLDPQSRREIWAIVRRHQARGRTTLITTHYMDEAERLCDRVAVVDHGKIIALGTPSELIARLGGGHVVEFAVNRQDLPLELGRVSDIPGIESACRQRDGFLLTVSAPHLAIPRLLERLNEWNYELNRLTTRHASLEDVFVSLTGRHIEDDGGDSASVGPGHAGHAVATE